MADSVPYPNLSMLMAGTRQPLKCVFYTKSLAFGGMSREGKILSYE